ncbi:MAG: hypothetical protein ACXACA_01400 [Candidatus Ranarchaeia archaeon]|jgi:hypothetical protein
MNSALSLLLMLQGLSGEFSWDYVINNITIVTAGMGFVVLIVIYGNVKKILALFPKAKMSKNWNYIGIAAIIFQVLFMLLMIRPIMTFFGFPFEFPLERWLLPIVYILMAATVTAIVSVSFRTYQIILEATRE